MNEIIEKENIKIENMIYEIRGKQVMLDSDLAKLYQCKNGTKTINQSVKRNVNRFPEMFMFQLTNDELKCLQSQIGTANYRMSRSLPYAFTEQGVAMLATVLRTNVAEEISIAIMDAFISMRKYINSNLIEQKYINNQVIKNAEYIRRLQESFAKLESKKKTNEIYFNGQIYDAYSKIISIMKESKKELIIIDNYADISVLDMISKINKSVTLITKKNANLKQIDINKYNSQYKNLKIIYNTAFHERYIILDNQIIYHMGASINHAGTKTFSINKLEDEIVINAIIDNIKTIILKSNINN